MKIKTHLILIKKWVIQCNKWSNKTVYRKQKQTEVHHDRSKENQSANQKETGPVSLITSHYSLCLLCIVCVFFIHLFLKHLEICMWEHFTERYSHLCTCMLMISLFVPCHICKALASKKKSKSRKVSKPAKQEGRTHAHCHLFFFFIYLVESVHASTMSNLFFYSCSCCCSKTKNK